MARKQLLLAMERKKVLISRSRAPGHLTEKPKQINPEIGDLVLAEDKSGKRMPHYIIDIRKDGMFIARCGHRTVRIGGDQLISIITIDVKKTAARENERYLAAMRRQRYLA